MNMFAIIGGSGLAKLSALDSIERRVMRTPYGEPSGAITLGRLGGRDIVFLARHGYGHTIAPHEINYRANIWALKELKVRGILAVATVGSVNEALVPGTLVVPDQLIDYTYGRKSTFFEGSETPVTHIDFTEPYSNELRLR
ncbi:MAG: 5'-methylthioadenosine phosphorylase, partial [Burkholderiaceae bacterium]